MSKKQAIAFFEELSKNSQLAHEVEKVVGGKSSDEEKVQELISLAQSYNLNFTQEEAASAQEALKKPLSPEEILEVSGGKINLKSSLMAMALLAGLGVGGATMSNMEASAMKRTNYSSSARSSGKSGKRDSTSSLQPQTPNGSQQGSPATIGTQQQTTIAAQQGESLYDAVMRHARMHQSASDGTAGQQQRPPHPLGAANSRQNETPASSGQGTRPETHQPQLDRTEGREDMTYERLVRWANEREIKIALLQEDCDRLAGKYKEDRAWIEMVACAVANGFFPDFNKKLEKTSVSVPQEGVEAPCAYCGKTGCVKVGEPYTTGVVPVRCTNVGCPLNWVVYNHVRKVSARERSITPTDRDVTRWDQLPQLIEEIKDLVDRTEYAYDEDDCLPVQLHVSAESARQANDERKRKKEAKQREKARWQTEAAKEEARQQAIEKLQRGEKLSFVEAKAIAPMLKCDNCGNTGAKVQNTNGRIYFYCKSCNYRLLNKPADRLDMLLAAAPGNMPMGMANAEQNEQQMQFEIQPMQMGMQSMNQFNPQQQTMMMHNTLQKEDEDDGLPPPTSNRKSKEVKERRKDYENQEPMEFQPGTMIPIKRPQTQMMNQTGFNFHGQGMNQINSMHPIQTNDQNFFTSDLNQRMDEIIDVNAFDNDEEKMNDAPSSEKQTRPNASLSAFRPSAMEYQIVSGANSTHRFRNHAMTQPLQLNRLPQDFNEAFFVQRGATNAFNSNQNRTQTMPNQMEEENSDTITDENI